MSEKFNELENNDLVENEETVAEETEEEAVGETLEETEETIEETVEEAVEEVKENIEDAEETAEEIYDEVSDEVMETAEDVIGEDGEVVVDGQEAIESFIEENIVEPAKKSKAPVIVAIIVIIALIGGIAATLLSGNFGGNKYNKMGYLAVSGMTVGDICEQIGIGLDEFLTTYGLPADMPADTTEEAAFYNIPLAKFAEMNGYDVEGFKTQLKVPAETTVTEPKTILGKIKNIFNPQKPQPITDETPWGIVLDELTLGAYVGAESLEDFKAYYELDESVTVDTLYKEVREDIDKKTLELIAEQQKALEEAEAQAEGETSNDAENAEQAEETQTDADVTAEETAQETVEE